MFTFGDLYFIVSLLKHTLIDMDGVDVVGWGMEYVHEFCSSYVHECCCCGCCGWALMW